MDQNDNQPTVGQQLDGLMASLQQSQARAEAASEAAGDTCTLKYAMEQVVVSLSDEIEMTLRQYFEQNEVRLGLPKNGNLGVRSDGKPADADAPPEAGRVYTASVARETKGS